MNIEAPKMIKLAATLVAIASSTFVAGAFADAKCEGPVQDGDIWNLVCSADDAHEDEDVYQCDYFVSVTDSDGLVDQEEATGSVAPGQNGAVIWSSAVHGDDTRVVSATIDHGSCSR